MPGDEETHTLADHRSLVFAVDSSEHSAAAVEWATTHFFQKDDRLTLVHVVEFSPVAAADPMGHGAVFTMEMNARLEREAKEAGSALLQDLAKRCLGAVAHVHTVLLSSGSGAKHAIAAYADEKKPDFVLVSSRGLGAIKRFVLGSVSDFLCHHCSCSVMVIKGDVPAPSGDHKE